MTDAARSNRGPPRVALPETRQLDVLAQLLERRGVDVVRCPMIAIKDAPDAAPVLAWIRRAIDSPFDLLLIYTGEGVQRLCGFAEREGIGAAFVGALAATPLLTRGPKPVRALRKLDIKPAYEAAVPTTDGVITTLDGLDLAGKRVGVQLYGTDPNRPLMDYLERRGIEPDCVAPYVYASESDEVQVQALLGELAAGRVDAVAFTSKSQVERMRKVAAATGGETAFRDALAGVVVAAVGPVVADELGNAGIEVDVMPESDFFMKPLVTHLMRRLEQV